MANAGTGVPTKSSEILQIPEVAWARVGFQWGQAHLDEQRRRPHCVARFIE